MKYFKYWAESTFNIRIGRQRTPIKLLAGSNISESDALREGQRRADDIEQRIAAGESREDYRVPIREKVLDVIAEDSVITVCRYGAKILNTRGYTILDLDDYPTDFMDIFRSLGKLTKKERIVYKFESRLKKLPALGKDFRIYETAKGIRVIGKTFVDPERESTQSLLRKFNVDWLYIALSRRQACYRARLTPKPFRMKIQTIKIKSPLDCERQSYADWAAMYELKAKEFSVVKLLKTLGADFSKEQVIREHDRYCNLSAEKRLA